jgi:CheY-like chemotaxis protein
MHVLLIEDSRDDATLMIDFLAEEKGPKIAWVKDGVEALDYVFQRGSYEQVPRPDIILLDLALPRLSGYEALYELKHHPASQSIPVIILTTSYNPVDFNNCIRAGADAFFSKPSNLQGYEDLVQQLIYLEFPRLTDGYEERSLHG